MIRFILWLARCWTRSRYEDCCASCGRKLTDLELDVGTQWCWRCNERN